MQQAPIKAAASSAKYTGVLHAVGSVYREEGLRSFWRGNLAATGLWVSYSALQFSSYRALAGASSRALGPDFCDAHKATLSAAHGALAGVVATALTYPLDLFRTVFASQGVPKRFPTTRALAAHMWATRGVRGFYSGLPSTLLQIAPYMGLSFGIYSSLNSLVATHRRDKDAAELSVALTVLSYVGTGGAAGFASKLAVYPLDTLKKRMQMRQVPRDASYGVIPMYASTRACLVDVLRREGVMGLYKGTAPSLIKSVVAHSSTFASYEVAVLLIRRWEFQRGWEDLT